MGEMIYVLPPRDPDLITRLLPFGASHHCACPGCYPDEFPSGPPCGPAHFAIRFNQRHSYLQAFLDGKPFMRAVEILCGSPGWLVALYEPVHLCLCGSGKPCQRIRHGETRVEGRVVRDR